MADMASKGRWVWGRATAKLTDEQVAIIRHSKEHYMVLIAQFGVSKRTIHNIRNGDTWKHIA